MDGIPFIFLIPAAITDWKRRQIPLIWGTLCGVIALVYQMIVEKERIIDITGSLLVGVILLIIAKLFQQCIGYGDGIVFCILGVWIGFWNSMAVLFLALILSSIMAIFLLFIRKKKGTDRIPFIPFVLAAYTILWILEGV